MKWSFGSSILRSTILMLCSTILFAATAQARTPNTVYLKDGGIIECQKAWQANGKVSVLINRDSLVTLSRDEVNLQKTFPKKDVKRVNRGKMRKTPSHPSVKPGKVAAARQRTDAITNSKPAPPAPPQAAPARPPAVNPPAETAGAQPIPPRPPVKPEAAASRPDVASPQEQVPTATPADEALQRKMEQELINKASEIPSYNEFMIKSILLGLVMNPIGQVILALIILTIAILWKVFEKAGEPGWKGIVPVYNLFMLVKISGRPWWWGILLFLPLVGMVIAILYNVDLSKRFGKGPLFGLGLCFLPTIFFSILAFGDAEYN